MHLELPDGYGNKWNIFDIEEQGHAMVSAWKPCLEDGDSCLVTPLNVY